MVGLVGTQFGLLILLNSVLAKKNLVIIYLYHLLWVVLSPWGFIFLKYPHLDFENIRVGP